MDLIRGRLGAVEPQLAASHGRPLIMPEKRTPSLVNSPFTVPSITCSQRHS